MTPKKKDSTKEARLEKIATMIMAVTNAHEELPFIVISGPTSRELAEPERLEASWAEAQERIERMARYSVMSAKALMAELDKKEAS